MIVIDGSLVNVLLPDMVRDLDLSSTDVLWVNSIYSLLFAALLIPVGADSDKVRPSTTLPDRCPWCSCWARSRPAPRRDRSG